MSKKQLETLVQETGLSLFQDIRKNQTHFTDKTWWYEKILSLTIKDPVFKTNMFHFIDVLPNLKTPEQISLHLNEYFKGQSLGLLTSGLGQLAPSLMAKTIKKQIHEMAKIFITGSDLQEGLKAIPKIKNQNLCFSFDLLGEATLSRKEAQEYHTKYLDLMDALLKEQTSWEHNPHTDTDVWGKIPSINISIKASSLYYHIKEEAWEFTKTEIKNQLRPLFQKAVDHFIFINLDMEQYCYNALLNETFKELLLETPFKDYPHFGIVVQAYLKNSFETLQDLVLFSKKRKQPITVRLVKGAYWDSEVLLAKQKNWPIPVYTSKSNTDFNFEKCLEFLFENKKCIKIAVGSHNVRSISKALALHQLYPDANLEFQTLYGMGLPLAKTLTKKGYRVRLYSTIGELIPGMAYLVRRLLENTANQSFIQANLTKNISEKSLLSPPQPYALPSKTKKENQSFQNAPVLDFTIQSNRVNFENHLKKWSDQFPMEVPALILGKKINSQNILKRENPSQSQQIISHTHLSSLDQAEQSVKIASHFFEEWKNTQPQTRIQCLKKLSSLLKKKQFELAALQVFEVGKTWAEAHADICEAIDFCNYYSQSYFQIFPPQKTCEISGETSFLHYEALGPTAIIAPWNFPLAILTGMVVAPLVCGNPVIIKPAEQSSLTAYQLALLLLESGFPKESFSFLPGEGEKVGAYLVQHPSVPLISFTGSFEVGSQIIKETKKISLEHKHIKKAIVEMGGKNAILVDTSADLDEAISGILTSAFSFQGQKCSACSRVLILEDIYPQFMERFLPAVKSLIVDDPQKPQTFLGPLIDQKAYQKIKDFIQKMQTSPNVEKIYEGSTLSQGWFISPTIFLTDQPHSPCMQEELFAPLLTCFKVKDFDQALQIANNTKYGLTSALYSRKPSHIQKYKQNIEAGNIYINRNCTGALVERHPFGGYKMSGLGSKAGGAHYLKQFLHEKVITENTLRQGFSPEIFSDKFLEDIQKESD